MYLYLYLPVVTSWQRERHWFCRGGQSRALQLPCSRQKLQGWRTLRLCFHWSFSSANDPGEGEGHRGGRKEGERERGRKEGREVGEMGRRERERERERDCHKLHTKYTPTK